MEGGLFPLRNSAGLGLNNEHFRVTVSTKNECCFVVRLGLDRYFIL